jgi:hypothetical protein
VADVVDVERLAAEPDRSIVTAGRGYLLVAD